MKVLVVGLIVLSGCTFRVSEPNVDGGVDGEYGFSEAKAVGFGVYRLENSEVICYRYNGLNKAGLSCKFK